MRGGPASGVVERRADAPRRASFCVRVEVYAGRRARRGAYACRCNTIWDTYDHDELRRASRASGKLGDVCHRRL